MSIKYFDRPFNRQVVTKPMGAPTDGPHFFEPIPADWHTDPDYHNPKDDLFHIVDSKNAGEVLAIVVRVAGGFEETQSNARLFAASWEMRSRLHRLHQYLGDLRACGVTGPAIDAELAETAELLRKVEGR